MWAIGAVCARDNGRTRLGATGAGGTHAGRDGVLRRKEHGARVCAGGACGGECLDEYNGGARRGGAASVNGDSLAATYRG